MRRAVWWSVASLVACAPPSAPSRESEPPSPVAARVARPPDVPPVAPPPWFERVTWTFYDLPGPLGCGLFEGGLGDRCDPHLVGDPRTYAIEAGHLVCDRDGHRLYDVPLELASTARAFVVGDRSALHELHVAAVVDGDIVLQRRADVDGALRAEHRVRHEGSPATRVQLEVRDAGFLLHVEAARPWYALLDPESGVVLARAAAGVGLEELTGPGPDGLAERARASATFEGADLRVTARRGRVEGRGAHPFSVALRDPFHCGAYRIMPVGTELAVLHHCPGTSGASMAFIDRETGALDADIVAGTIGTIGHSAYRAVVSATARGDRITVDGSETGGRYRCILDATARRTLACWIQRS